MRKIFIFLSSIIFLSIFLSMAAALQARELAIGGYDPVAYFAVNQPVKGSAQHKLIWNDAIWFFSSAENRKTFQAAPQKYAPQYNGWCAYAMSQGYVAEIDPINGWTLNDGKLYLNWSSTVKYIWLGRKAHHIDQANMNWPDIHKKLAADQVKISRK